MGIDPDPDCYCTTCGAPLDWEGCDVCGGEGGFDGEVLMRRAGRVVVLPAVRVGERRDAMTPAAENLIRAVDALRAAEQAEADLWRRRVSPYSEAGRVVATRVVMARLILVAAAYTWREEQADGQVKQEPAG